MVPGAQGPNTGSLLGCTVTSPPTAALLEGHFSCKVRLGQHWGGWQGCAHPAHCIASLLPTPTAIPAARFPPLLSRSLLQAAPNNPASNKGKTQPLHNQMLLRKVLLPGSRMEHQHQFLQGRLGPEVCRGKGAAFSPPSPSASREATQKIQALPAQAQCHPAQPGPLQSQLGTSL